MIGIEFLHDPAALAAFVVWLLPLILENWAWLQAQGEALKRIFVLILAAIVSVLAYFLGLFLMHGSVDINALATLMVAVAGMVLSQVSFPVNRWLGLIAPSSKR